MGKQIRSYSVDLSFPYHRIHSVMNSMISKRVLLNGGLILLICLACILPAVAIELNPISYFVKKPVSVQTLNKTVVRDATGTAPLQRVTARPQVTFATAAGATGASAVSHVSSGAGTCSQDSPVEILEGTITRIQYTDVFDTTFTFMKLTNGGEVALFPVDGGDRARVYHLLETAYTKGNTIHIATNGGCSLESFASLDGGSTQYPTYKIVVIELATNPP